MPKIIEIYDIELDLNTEEIDLLVKFGWDPDRKICAEDIIKDMAANYIDISPYALPILKNFTGVEMRKNSRNFATPTYIIDYYRTNEYDEDDSNRFKNNGLLQMTPIGFTIPEADMFVDGNANIYRFDSAYVCGDGKDHLTLFGNFYSFFKGALKGKYNPKEIEFEGISDGLERTRLDNK